MKFWVYVHCWYEHAQVKNANVFLWSEDDCRGKALAPTAASSSSGMTMLPCRAPTKISWPNHSLVTTLWHNAEYQVYWCTSTWSIQLSESRWPAFLCSQSGLQDPAAEASATGITNKLDCTQIFMWMHESTHRSSWLCGKYFSSRELSPQPLGWNL